MGNCRTQLGRPPALTTAEPAAAGTTIPADELTADVRDTVIKSFRVVDEAWMNTSLHGKLDTTAKAHVTPDADICASPPT